MSRINPDLVPENPWDVSEQAYASSTSLRDKLMTALNYAVLAPSGHNTQPWLFRVGYDHVDVHADRSRALPVVDPHDRELVMSCGAAVFHLSAALRHYGNRVRVTPFPKEADEDLVARVEVTGSVEPTLADHRLFMAIKRRHTNRQPFEERAVPEIELAAMDDAVVSHGVTLSVCTRNDQKRELAAVIAQADQIQGSNKHFRRELAAWMRSNRSRRQDGIPGAAIGVGDLGSIVGPLVVRTVDWGGGQAARDEQLATGSPVLAVLSTDGDDERSWLSAGNALSHLLLLAADYGIQASYLNQPLEVDALRSRVVSVAGTRAHPQIILRMGYGSKGRRTPRRPISDVLLG